MKVEFLDNTQCKALLKIGLDSFQKKGNVLNLPDELAISLENNKTVKRVILKTANNKGAKKDEK